MCGRRVCRLNNMYIRGLMIGALVVVFARSDHQTDLDGTLTQQSRALQTKLTYRWYW